jgi:dihydropteroate synthase
VARAALAAGASIINDITALADDGMAELAAESQVPVALMHMQGTPRTMQAGPSYEDVVGEVLHFLVTRARRAESFGIGSERIWIDPGIGFGKTVAHNLLLLKHVPRFVATNHRVLVGASRKRFIGTITGREKPADRVFGTAATVALCAAAGVSVVRVHDVAAMRDVVKIVRAVQEC